jgi:hypothetical protein
MLANVGRAARFSARMRGEEGDLIRVDQAAEALLVASANATDSGFGTCWAEASRLLLDLFLAEWRAAAGTIGERLYRAVGRMQSRFVHHAAGLVRPDAGDLADGPGATITAVATDRQRVWCEWIGDAVALHIRDGAPLWRTRPHTLGEDLLAQGASETHAARGATVLTRWITAGGPIPVPADHLAPPDVLFPGDRLVLVSGTVLVSFATAGIARLVGRVRSPQLAADEIVQHALVERVPYAAAVVVELA